MKFDLERHKQAPTSEQNDEAKAKQIGLAQSPFKKEDFQVKDGRYVSITNSAFGAVYAHIDTKAYPFATRQVMLHLASDTAVARVSSSLLVSSRISLRKVWSKKIVFITFNIDYPELLPVGPIQSYRIT